MNPSAKLPITFPRTVGQLPLFYAAKPSGRGYGYVENDGSPLYPFGYGLSYTTFEYANLDMASEVTTDDEAFTLSFDVKNTGAVKADEVAQIYLSPADSNPNVRPIQLQGFARITLEPGQTRRVEVKMYVEQFGYYSNEGQRQWNIAPGEFIVKVGASSQDIRLSEEISIEGETIVKPLRDYYFSESTVN